MTKNHKWTLIPFIVAIASIIALTYFLAIRKSSSPAEPIKAIPVNASVIVKVNDFMAVFNKVTVNNSIWNELKIIPAFSRIDRQLHFIDSLYRFVPEVTQIIQNPPSFLSFHFTGKDKISVMHVFQLPPRYHERKITDLLSKLVTRSGTIKTRSYEGIDIYEAAMLDAAGVENFSYAVYHDLLLISFSTVLLEDAIRQLNRQESVTHIQGFNAIYATAGKNVDANVFVNFRQLPRSLSVFVKPEFKSEVRSFKNFAGWGELDVNLLTEKLMMNGFVLPPDSVSSMASLFLHQTPQRITPDKILPASVASFLTISLSDPEEFFDDYQAFLRDKGQLSGYKNTLQSLNNAYGTNFPSELVEIANKEITIAFNHGYRETTVPEVFFLMRIKSKTQAEEKMKSILSRIASVESRSLSSYITPYKLDADLSYTIYYLPIRKFASKIFGGVFAPVDEHYFTVVDDYLVFGSTVESIKLLIHNFVLNKTLQNDQAFRAFKNNLSPRSNLCFYCNLSKGQSVYDQYLANDLRDSWLKYLAVFQKNQVAGFQIFANNNMLYSNFILNHLSSFNTSAQTVWESKLDTAANFKPVFVLNHRTNQNEVFIQDLNNTIYLINQVGRILWKINLSNRINSDVFQIDYFRNGKLQLLFSTKNEIYLIDHNGNYVGKFPIKLRSPATNGVSVFDYDNNKNYRLFIACEDKHVYAYTHEGNIVNGWEFGLSESEVTHPVNHFRIGDKDFLVFGDRFKTYILDRRGDTRVEVDTFFPLSANNNYLLYLPRDGSSPSIVTTDTTGKAYFLGFNGSVKTIDPPGRFTNRHFFDFKDLDGDALPEFIYFETDKLTVLKPDQSKLFTYQFRTPVDTKPQYYQFSSTDRKLGIVSRSENRIYLINNDGSLYKGFPLHGNTPFSIGDFGDSLAQFNLIVGSNDHFLYNYRVQ